MSVQAPGHSHKLHFEITIRIVPRIIKAATQIEHVAGKLRGQQMALRNQDDASCYLEWIQLGHLSVPAHHAIVQDLIHAAAESFVGKVRTMPLCRILNMQTPQQLQRASAYGSAHM